MNRMAREKMMIQATPIRAIQFRIYWIWTKTTAMYPAFSTTEDHVKSNENIRLQADDVHIH